MDIISLFKSLPNVYFMGNFTEEAIAEAETKLCLSFASDYKEFLKNFGGMVYKQIEIIGINPEFPDNCVESTLEARSEDSSIPSDCYVISNPLIDGILYLQNASGQIYVHYPFMEPEKLFDNLQEFVLSF